MEQKKTGKRLEEQGSSAPRSHRGLLAIGAVALVLAGAYLGLCVYAGALAGPMPGAHVAGVDVSGLPVNQIEERLAEEFFQRTQTVRLAVEGESISYELPHDAVEADVEKAARDALRLGRDGGFLAQGAGLIKGLTSGHQGEVAVTFSEKGEAAIDALIADVEADLGGLVQETAWEVEGQNLVFRMGKPGKSLDAQAVKKLVLDHIASGEDTVIKLTPATTDPAQPDLEEIHTRIFTEMKDSALDPETKEILPSVTGVDFDVEQARAALERADWGEKVSIPLVLTQPKVSTEQLKALLFRDVLGQATSRVGGSANRKFNVALAASTFEGRILLPGEVFSYNGTTGSRTAEKGYKLAPVYKGGKSVDEIGGGICQPSSTLYLASLNGNLKIVERHHHTYAVGYVPDGMDATVYYGSLDYQFENDSAYPIKLVSESYEKGGSTYLTIRIYGTKEDDYMVKMENKVYDWVTYSTIYKVDPAVPAGTTKQEQSPYRGRTADTYRNVYDKDGVLISSTLETTNKYKMRDQIILVNPGDAAQYGLNPDGTPLTAPPSAAPVSTPAPTPEGSPAPEPTVIPVPTQTPAAAITPVPDQTPEPSASSEPTQSQQPGETPDPAASPEPDPPAPSQNAGGTEYGVPLLPGLPEADSGEGAAA